MKRVLCILAILIVAFIVASGCGKKNDAFEFDPRSKITFLKLF